MIILNLENIYRSHTGAKEDFSLEGKLGLEQEFAITGSAKINLNGTLSRLDDGVRLVAETCEAVVETTCDRCLEPFPLNASFSFENFFTNSQVEHLRDRALVLDGQLQENLILSVPIKKICNDACRGLCPDCGQNLNTKKCNCKSTPFKKNPFSKILKG